VRGEQLGSERRGLLEVTLASFGLAALTAVVFGASIDRAGFFNDDWNYLGSSHFPPSFGAAVRELDYLSFRPLMMLYWPFAYRGLGTDPTPHLVLTLAVAVLVSALLFAVLRRLGVERGPAAAVAVLVLLSPAADSTRFWPAMSANVLAVALWLGGVLAALAALRRPAASLWWHLPALALYLASVLLYEIAATAVLATGAGYVALAGRRGLARWALDAFAILATLALVTSHTFYDPLPPGGMARHAVTVAREAAVVFADSWWAPAEPGAAATLLACGFTAAVLAVGWLTARAGGDTAAHLRRWVLIAAAAALGTAVAYLMHVPSAEVSPGGEGQFNRSNVLAAIGVTLLVVATTVVAATLASRRSPAWRSRSTTLAAAAALVIGAGYVVQLNRDAGAWSDSVRRQAVVLDAVGLPPAGSVVFAFGVPAAPAAGVPVFGAVWDLRGALELRRGERTLRAYPVPEGSRVDCGATELTLHNYNDAFERQSASYAQALLVDVPGRRRLRVADSAGCRRVTAGLLR